MRNKLKVLLVGAALTVGLLPAVALASQTEPGTPGDPNCFGQTMAFLAQLVKTEGIEEVQPGIGNLAKAIGLSNKELKAFVEELCATPVGP